MTPNARLASAAAILDALDWSCPIEPQLRSWARSNRYAGSKDRKAIADRVYTCLRRFRSCSRCGNGRSGRALVLGSLRLADGLSVDEIDEMCAGPYGLGALSSDERACLGGAVTFASDGERLDWPDWLMPEAERAFGDDLDRELDALRKRAPLDIRVNLLKSDLEGAQAALETEGLHCQRVEVCATALRLPAGANVTGTTAYSKGLVEPQDSASQAVADFADAKPGDTVLDFCAGAGGKALAIAARMQNEGVLIAHDVAQKRMVDLPARAMRAGASMVLRKRTEDLAPATFDLVFVDAPCSGSGSWRRDPAGKWRLTEMRLSELRRAQREALENAARFVRSGGRLVYATCSVMPCENEDQIEWFLSCNPEASVEEVLMLYPARDKTDGFYAARLRFQGD